MESKEHRSGPGTASRGWLGRGEIPARPTNVQEALRALDTVSERLLAEGDARAAFPDIYGIITRRVAESVEISERKGTLGAVHDAGRPGEVAFFCEPAWISRLAARFCERYLETLRWSYDGGRQDCGSWQTTYDVCGDRGTLPLEHVLLGLSSHINFDLAMGIHRTIVEFGVTDPATLRRYKHDHDAVNDLLRASIPEAFDHLMIRHRCEAASLIVHRTYAFAEWATMHILSSWRARVWDDAMAMLAARTVHARQVIVDRMERLSRRYARILSLPGVVPMALHAPAGAWHGAGRGKAASRGETAQAAKSFLSLA